MKFTKSLVIAAFAVVIGAAQAHAATITRSFSYESDTTGPIAHNAFTFTFSYDSVTLDATLLAINYGIGSTIFSPANAAIMQQGVPGFFSLYGAAAGTGFQFIGGVGNDDFHLGFELADLGNTQFSYSTATAAPNFGIAPNDIPLIEIRTPGVPEPATWAMMIVGFGIIGGALRARSSSNRAHSGRRMT